MNTITITEKDISEKLSKYKGDKYFENFIFNDFRIISRVDNHKNVYKVHINENINEVLYRIIMDGSYKDCEFKFTENEEGWKFIETPKGDMVNDWVESMIRHDGESLSNDDISKRVYMLMCGVVELIIRLKQYIMNESYKRTTITKDSNCKAKVSDNGGSKQNNHKRKPVEQFLLGDIVEYVNSNRREFKITCECWNVRGHFRHYKSGKVIWIAEYEKGEKRNTNTATAEHIYNI